MTVCLCYGEISIYTLCIIDRMSVCVLPLQQSLWLYSALPLLSGLLIEMGIDYRPLRLDHPVESFVKVFTFNANRKSMSTVVRNESGYRLLTKGASEIVLNRCTHVLEPNGQVRIPLNILVYYSVFPRWSNCQKMTRNSCWLTLCKIWLRMPSGLLH